MFKSIKKITNNFYSIFYFLEYFSKIVCYMKKMNKMFLIHNFYLKFFLDIFNNLKDIHENRFFCFIIKCRGLEACFPLIGLHFYRFFSWIRIVSRGKKIWKKIFYYESQISATLIYIYIYIYIYIFIYW